jgi:hypothetical protein
VGGDPIIQTFLAKTFLAKLNSYGATKFLADGAVQGSDGSSGTGKAFDIEHHIAERLTEDSRERMSLPAGRRECNRLETE